MNRFTVLLLLVILVELGVSAWLIARRVLQPIPPAADWELFDPHTADQIQIAMEDDRSAEDWRTVAELYMAAGCLRESEACHRVACELEPQNGTLARQWGFALERLALLDQANEQYQRAIDLGIRNPHACRYLIARNHLRADKLPEARTWFDEGQALLANSHELARLELRAGNLDRTESLLRNLAQKHPDTLQVQLLRYRLAKERGNAHHAALHADRARYAPSKLHNPFDEEAARIVRATTSLGLNRMWGEVRDAIKARQFENAERLLNTATDQDAPQVTELQAELAFARGDFTAAIELFKKFQERSGPAARIMVRIGDAWDAAGNPVEARAQWLKAAQLESGANLKDVHHKLAASFAKAKIQPEGESHLARGHYFVGRDLLQIGHADKSLDYFAAAVRHDRQFAQAWFYLGEARRLSGDRHGALAAYETCLRLKPHHGRAIAAIELIEGN